MVEALVISVLGSFVYDNLDFFHVVKEQRKDGYRWEMNIKDRNPDVPAIPFKYDDGTEKVIWVLQK